MCENMRLLLLGFLHHDKKWLKSLALAESPLNKKPAGMPHARKDEKRCVCGVRFYFEAGIHDQSEELPRQPI
jgi:hypothetical protein